MVSASCKLDNFENPTISQNQIVTRRISWPSPLSIFAIGFMPSERSLSLTPQRPQNLSPISFSESHSEQIWKSGNYDSVWER